MRLYLLFQMQSHSPRRQLRMNNDSRLWPLYKSLLVVLGLLTASCRTDTPPAQELCALNGYGLGDCVEPDGSQVQKTPSQMVNYVARSPAMEQSWDAWCFNTSESNVAPAMQFMYSQARK